MDELQLKTMSFFLGAVAAELEREIDWRAGGHGKGALQRAGIYAAALGRDLARIPTHHREGIAQARFRARVGYITEVAIPAVRFFLAEFPLNDDQARLLDEAIGELERGAGLIADGPMPALDRWYATMDEFHLLTEHSRQASGMIRNAIGELTGPRGVEV